MSKITLSNLQARLLKEEAENGKNGVHRLYKRDNEELDALEDLGNKMDRLLVESGEQGEKELAKYGYNMWQWFYDKYNSQE